MSFIHNSQTLAIENAIEAGETRLIIAASPGTGKTTVGSNVIARQFINLYGNRGFSLVFSNKNKKDNEQSMANLNLNGIKVQTLNALGYSMTRAWHPKIKLHGGQWNPMFKRKMPHKLDELLNAPAFSDFKPDEKIIIKGICSNAKCLNLEPYSPHDDWGKAASLNTEMPEELFIEMAKELLRLSDSDETQIDFDDQIRFAIKWENAQAPKMDWVIIDEAQDINPANLALIRKILKGQNENFPVAVLADVKQSIYGFRGAVGNEMLETFKAEWHLKEFPLTICYRCASAICEKANSIYAESMIPHESTGTGTVQEMPMADFAEMLKDISDDSFIMCRNNAPLIKVLFQCLKAGKQVRMAGGTEYAAQLQRSISYAAFKAKTKDLVAVRIYLLNELEKWELKCNSPRKPKWLGELRDKTNMLCFLIEGMSENNPGATVKELAEFLKNLFQEPKEGQMMPTLATYHSSKGLQRTDVYLLGHNIFCPSPYADSPDDLIQENNLAYVAFTRAKQNLVFINGEKTEF